MTDMTKQTEAISTERALKLALEALEIERNVPRLGPVPTKTSKAITALREALTSVPDWTSEAKEQPAPATELREQEPVAWMYPDDYERMTTSETFCTVYSVEVGSATRGESTVALYTSPPPQRTWVGLRDDEIYSVLENLQIMHHRPPTTDSRVIFAQAIEAKLKEKNT